MSSFFSRIVSREITLDSIHDCGTWRKWNLDSVFPEAFTCSFDGQKEPYNTCVANLEDGVPPTYNQRQGEPDDEVILIHFLSQDFVDKTPF